MLELISLEEFFRLQEIPIEKLTEDEKQQMALKKMSLMSEQEMNDLFDGFLKGIPMASK
jgi:RAB protein geranylgeranyltransferase component A